MPVARILNPPTPMQSPPLKILIDFSPESFSASVARSKVTAIGICYTGLPPFGLDPDESENVERGKEVAIVVGQEDGGLWLFRTNVMKESENDLDKGVVEAVLSDNASTSTRRSISLAHRSSGRNPSSPRINRSPTLSRSPSSSFLPSVLVSPPSASSQLPELSNSSSLASGMDHSLPQARSRASSSGSGSSSMTRNTSKTKHHHHGEFLPFASLPPTTSEAGTSMDRSSSSPISPVTVSAQLGRTRPRDDKDRDIYLKERLRNAQRHANGSETPDRLASLAALGRGNLTNIKGKSSSVGVSGDVSPLAGIAESKLEGLAKEIDRGVNKKAFDDKEKDRLAMRTERQIDEEVEEERVLDEELERVFETTGRIAGADAAIKEKEHQAKDLAKNSPDLIGSSPFNSASSKKRDDEIGERCPVRIIPHSSNMDYPVSIVPLSKVGSVAIISAHGYLAILDTADVLLGEIFDAQATSREKERNLPDLSPRLRWKKAEVVTYEEVEYLIVSGERSESAALVGENPSTMVLFLELVNGGEKVISRGKIVLPNSGPVSVAIPAQGTSILLQLVDNQLYRYDLQIGPKRTAPPSPVEHVLHGSRSATNLRSIFTPMPSRPVSRAGSIKEASSSANHENSIGGFAKLLGRKNKGPSEAEQTRINHAVTVLLESKLVALDLGAAGWTDLEVDLQRNEGLAWYYDGAVAFDLTSWNKCVSATDSTVKYGWYEDDLASLSTSLPIAAPPWRLNRNFAVSGTLLAALTTDGISLLDKRWNTGKQTILGCTGSTIDIDGSQESLAKIMSLQEGQGTTFVAFGKNGGASEVNLANLLRQNSSTKTLTSQNIEDIASVSSLCQIKHPKSSGIWIVAGGQDGSLRLWIASPFHLVESISIFPEAIISITQPTVRAGHSLSGKILLLSSCGSVGIFDLEDLDLLYIIPGSRGAFAGLILKDDDVILPYSSGKARVWNLSTLEFRRSTATDAAEDMLAGGPWQWLIQPNVSKVQSSAIAIDLEAMTVLADQPDTVVESALSLMLDNRLFSAGHLAPIGISIGIQEGNCTAIVSTSAKESVWSVSPLMTGLLSLFGATLVRSWMSDPATESRGSQVITEISAVIPTILDRSYVDISLEFLASLYNHKETDIHHSARMLLEARLARLSDAQASALVEARFNHLPVNALKSGGANKDAFDAVLLCGGLALRRYSLFSASTLKDIAASILSYLGKAKPPHQMLAIDLCHKGFDVWQNYVDPSELLRSLFALAVPKDINPSNSTVAAHARNAVLHLAADSSPMFVTTLSMDIMDARSVEERDSVMRLCVFVARKKPRLLFPSVPRVAEAVVKSLDPTRVHMRESIQETATIILNELVKIYPIIDFSGKVQRLAVGTSEGAVVMYDLKTATRLYVVETHQHQVSALAFSPDGRRLVTVSVSERKLTVWKVGSSFSSLFNIGGLPRQGNGLGEPFRTFEFALPKEAEAIDPATGLQAVEITWPADRSVSLNMGLVKMTFVT